MVGWIPVVPAAVLEAEFPAVPATNPRLQRSPALLLRHRHVVRWNDPSTYQTHVSQSLSPHVKGKKVKERIAVNGFPSHSYGTSLAIWDHTVLPATRHT